MKAKEEVKELMEEIEGFKEKCELLHSNNFPTFYNDDGNLHPKESFMTILVEIKEIHKGFEEKDHSLQGKNIMKLYNDHYDFLFFLKNIFKEWGKFDYGDITSLEGTIIEACSCGMPYDREWRTFMDLCEWTIQQEFTSTSWEVSAEAFSSARTSLVSTSIGTCLNISIDIIDNTSTITLNASSSKQG